MLKNIKSVYIVGIGGVSMSALAVMLLNRGIKVKGSDLHLSALTENLERQGVEIVTGDAPQFVLQCDAILYSGAIKEDNADLQYAKMLGKKIIKRAELLGFFSKEKKTISVSGTHGKTTTTGMISSVLLDCGEDPTIHIGGQLKCIGSNIHVGNGELFVCEACEYQDAFLSISNYISVVLNIEEEHLDYFKNFDAIKKSFNQFVGNTCDSGLVVYNYDACKDKIDAEVLKKYDTISFGFEDGAMLQAINISENCGKFSFDVFFKGVNLATITLSCIGRHNIYNALACVGVCLFLNLNIEEIVRGLENYQGVERRMETINKSCPLIIHDYAHHPQEIIASLSAIKNISSQKLICVFQPHTFTRTLALYNEFLECFGMCDEVWLLPIYPAREKEIEGVSSQKMCEDLKNNAKTSKYFENFANCREEILNKKYQDCIFAILGAGNIENLARDLEKEFKQKSNDN